ncbi:MAG: hypothetical protein GKS04_03175 [Candidatus Mycalebacterium zealandia]|nr:MAG: hypothetical protein GKS04_03175 [Candidatus Mycalebacterium zealandia]
MELNRDFISKGFERRSHIITQDEIAKYAAVIGGAGNTAYASGVAPPSFPVIYELPFLETIWSDPELNGGKEQAKKNVLMLVHGDQKMTFVKPLMAGMEVAFSAEVSDIQDKGSGEVLALRTQSMVDGEIVCESNWGLFVRGIGSGKKPERSAKKPSAPKPAGSAAPQTVFTSGIDVPADITPRYADASNDHNPIHLNEDVAKEAGLKGVVVHGLCTMSMAMQKIIDGYLGGAPENLKSLAVRFSAPVYPGDTLNLECFEAGQNAIKFEASVGGMKVIKGGFAEIM